MPNYKTHISGGVATFCILVVILSSFFVSKNINIMNIAQYFISCIVGSLFPDVDTKSKIQKIFYTVLLLLFITTLVQGNFLIFSILSFIGILPLIVHHRGLFHKPFFIILIALITILICHLHAPSLEKNLCLNLLFFVFGAFSHILLDVGIKKFFRI